MDKSQITRPQKPPSTLAPTRLQIDIPRKGYLIVIVLLAIPYFVVAGFLLSKTKWGRKAAGTSEVPPVAQAEAGNASDNATLGKPGPWGNLEYVRMFLEIPEEFLSVRSDETANRHWFFGGYSREKLSEFFGHLGLPANQLQLLNATPWEIAANGIRILPPGELVLNLAPGTRQRIYTVLAQFSENNWQREAFVFPSGAEDQIFANSGLPAKTVSLVKQLCYPHGKVSLFADMPWVLDTLPTYDEKLRLEKAASRRATLLLKVRVNSDSNIDSLLKYWGRAGMDKDLRPLLESLGKVPGGALVGLNNLLPPFPRSRLYRFPFPSLNQPENCHWTSFNFFKEKPEGTFDKVQELRAKIDSEYYPMFSDPKYGDVIFLAKPNGDIVHSAIFIADDIVYTKNGGHFTAPWMLMKIPDLIEAYSAFVSPDEPLQVLYYRNKYY
jgi:hypothetical protein